jgi:hypothetical protein
MPEIRFLRNLGKARVSSKKVLADTLMHLIRRGSSGHVCVSFFPVTSVQIAQSLFNLPIARVSSYFSSRLFSFWPFLFLALFVCCTSYHLSTFFLSVNVDNHRASFLHYFTFSLQNIFLNEIFIHKSTDHIL